LAMWQFRAWIVPARASSSTGAELAKAIREGTIDAWAGEEPGWCAKRVENLGLAPTESWDRHTAMWGSQEGHYVQETTAGTRVLEAETAIDARVVDLAYCRRLAQFVSDLNAKLVTADGLVVEGTEAEIIQAVQGSDVWRFIVDPESFLLTRSKSSDAE